MSAKPVNPLNHLHGPLRGSRTPDKSPCCYSSQSSVARVKLQLYTECTHTPRLCSCKAAGPTLSDSTGSLLGNNNPLLRAFFVSTRGWLISRRCSSSTMLKKFIQNKAFVSTAAPQLTLGKNNEKSMEKTTWVARHWLRFRNWTAAVLTLQVKSFLLTVSDKSSKNYRKVAETKKKCDKRDTSYFSWSRSCNFSFNLSTSAESSWTRCGVDFVPETSTTLSRFWSCCFSRSLTFNDVKTVKVTCVQKALLINGFWDNVANAFDREFQRWLRNCFFALLQKQDFIKCVCKFWLQKFLAWWREMTSLKDHFTTMHKNKPTALKLNKNPLERKLLLSH